MSWPIKEAPIALVNDVVHASEATAEPVTGGMHQLELEPSLFRVFEFVSHYSELAGRDVMPQIGALRGEFENARNEL